MLTEELAAQIYAQVVSNRILGAPKTWTLDWTLDPKQAAKIAQACLDAAEAFMTQSALAQSVEK